jgi:uncharacterized protein YutE (UPF0331/DUF86 family)/predicted Zn-dependent protease with MMP-like domain
MLNIKDFNSYINEALGIADPTLFCVDISVNRIFAEILDIIDSDPEEEKTQVKEIVINYSDIKGYVDDWNKWKLFPVSEIKVDLQVTKKPMKEVEKLKPGSDEEYHSVPFRMGAYASPFAKGREKMATRFKDQIKFSVDHTLSIHFGIDLDYSDLLSYSKNREKYEEDLNDTLENILLHEINHLYEYYSRKMRGRGEMETTLTYIAVGDNVHRRPKAAWKYWSNFLLYYIYMAEPHEIRAYTQECKSLVKNLKFKEFKEHKMYKEVESMKNFDEEKFVERFRQIISRVNPDNPNKTISLFISDFKKDYRKILAEYKEKGRLSPGALDRMSDTQFLRYWGKKIREAGKILQRRILRLYSYKHQ